VDDDRDQVLSLTALLRTEAYDVRGLHAAADMPALLRWQAIQSPHRSAFR